MEQLVNMNSHDAYIALGYAAGKFNVTVVSTQAHTRRATLLKECKPYKAGEELGIWYIRCKNVEQKECLLALAIGHTLHQAILLEPKNVKLDRVSKIVINKETFKAEKSEDITTYSRIESQ